MSGQCPICGADDPTAWDTNKTWALSLGALLLGAYLGWLYRKPAVVHVEFLGVEVSCIYIGQSGQGLIEVAKDGDITFSAGVAGQMRPELHIDTADPRTSTPGEVVNVVNQSATWRCEEVSK